MMLNQFIELMKMRMFISVFEKMKIFRSIIISYIIYVMNNFRRFKISTYNLFHNKSRTFNIATFSCKRMFWAINQNISFSSISFSSFPIRMILSNFAFSKARTRAKYRTIFSYLINIENFFTLRTNNSYFSTFPVSSIFVNSTFGKTRARAKFSMFLFKARKVCYKFLFAYQAFFNHIFSKIKTAVFSPLKKKQLLFQDLLTAVNRHTKTASSLAVIIIAFLFLFVNFSFAESQNRELLPDFSEDTVPVLNDILNNLRNRIDSNAKDFVDLTTAQTVVGVKTFSSFPITPSAAPTTNYQVSNKKYVDDSVGAISPTGLSNVIFCWNGYCNTTTGIAANYGLQFATDLITLNAGKYVYFIVRGTTFKEVMATKFRKISGISTVTIWALVWCDNAVNIGYVSVDIGGANNNCNSGATATPTWASAAIDVSGLANGTTYDVSIQLKSDAAGQVGCLGAIILIAS